jgi:hypothetical protein
VPARLPAIACRVAADIAQITRAGERQVAALLAQHEVEYGLPDVARNQALGPRVIRWTVNRRSALVAGPWPTPAPLRRTGEALPLCAETRRLISLLPSPKGIELFSTTPAECAARNRRQHTATPGPVLAYGTDATPAPHPTGMAPVADLLDDYEIDAGLPVPISTFRRRSRS